MARQVLENGVILPAEYSDDWYDDMTSNLTKLDEVIGSDSEKLSSADVGAAALSNDYTDLDNKPDLTPYDTHLANLDIHVTAADKNRWNNNTYVFRYSSTALTPSSTNSNTLLDNTDNLKVGDKVIDSNGVLFSITAIDTQNSTFTIGTALIDLAKDIDVVHTSGNETVAGIKSFSDDTYIKSLNFINEVASPSSSSSAIMPLVTTVTYTDQTASKVARINLRIVASGDKSLYPHENNQYALGLTSRKWSEVHATSYYYGSSDVEFSTKFVTTDTAQSISGFKTIVGSYLTNEFSSNSRTCVQYVSNVDDSSESGIFLSKFAQGSSGVITRTQIGYDVYSNSVRTNRAFYLDFGSFVNDAPTKLEILSLLTTKNLGSIANKFTSVNTTRINELEPSALGMPDLSNGVDISGYITVNGGNKESLYTPPANGWVCVRLSRTSGALGVLLIQGRMASSGKNIEVESGVTTADATLPVVGGVQVSINSALADGVVSAKFFPCLGNV